MTNRLEHTINNLMNRRPTRIGRIGDSRRGFCKRNGTIYQNQILTQSSTAMLAQANTATQQVLQLLQ
jgi:hypothetical protein